MTVLIVGGDFLGTMVGNMLEHGATDVTHWDGRASGTLNKAIPERTDLVVVLTDYVSHKLCKIIKSKCKKTGCPIVYSRRSWIHLASAMEQVSPAARNRCKDCKSCRGKKKLMVY